MCLSKTRLESLFNTLLCFALLCFALLGFCLCFLLCFAFAYAFADTYSPLMLLLYFLGTTTVPSLAYG